MEFGRKRSSIPLCVIVVTTTIVGFSLLAVAAEFPYLNPAVPVEERVDDLLSRMTLEEKIGQMVQVNVTRLMGRHQWDRGTFNQRQLEIAFVECQVGSVLSGGGAAPLPNSPRKWLEMVNELQRTALDSSRLKIPIIYGVDAIHGHNNVVGATIFPHYIGMAATWDRELVQETAEATTRALRATNIHWNFGPPGDVGRDLRWGRFYETYGEDPFLVSEMAVSFLRGTQGERLGSNNAAACAKHFLGYSQPSAGKDRADADISLRSIRDIFLPPFEALIDSGVASIMVNSGSLNGIPAHASHYLLTKLLRDELGFGGVVISDFDDIGKLWTVHKVASSYRDAVAMGINAGVDMAMMSDNVRGFVDSLRELVNEGRVSQRRIDEAVRRILRLKFELGLFEHPFAPPDSWKVFDGSDRVLARRAASESITLLKNDSQLLPLSKEIGSVLVTGPSADSIPNLMGGWTIGWQGPENPQEYPPAVTVLEGVREAVSSKTNVYYAKGAPEPGSRDSHRAEAMLDEALKAAKKAEAVIAVVGETPYAEWEGDTTTAFLSPAQERLILSLSELGKPLILVLISGRPLMIADIIEHHSDAVLMAYLPGTEGGAAIADMLFGNVNPSGHLPFTWPKGIGEVPVVHNQLVNGRYEPLFPFGFGLSYTTFRYYNLTVSPKVARDGVLKVSVEVENTGRLAGADVVQLYITGRPRTGRLVPRQELVGFQRVELMPGKRATVNLEVPVERLALSGGDVLGEGPREVAPGSYKIAVGPMESSFEVE